GSLCGFAGLTLFPGLVGLGNDPLDLFLFGSRLCRFGLSGFFCRDFLRRQLRRGHLRAGRLQFVFFLLLPEPEDHSSISPISCLPSCPVIWARTGRPAWPGSCDSFTGVKSGRRADVPRSTRASRISPIWREKWVLRAFSPVSRKRAARSFT